MMLLIAGIVIGQVSSIFLFWACAQLASRDLDRRLKRPAAMYNPETKTYRGWPS